MPELPDPLRRLRRSDPAAFVAREARLDEPPPADVLERILSEPPPARGRRRPRVRRIVPAAVALAAAAAAALALLLPAGRGSLAERAYAATTPDGAVLFTESTQLTTGRGHRQVLHLVMWQSHDRMHNVMKITQDGKRFRLEHDQRAGVLRTLIDGKTLQRSRLGRGAPDVTTVVEEFRARISRLKDIGETTFNGRPARAYRSGDLIFYIDVDTALPLGRSLSIPGLRMVERIERIERLPATAANLAALDAPAIDAAEARCRRAGTRARSRRSSPAAGCGDPRRRSSRPGRRG